MEKLKKKLKDLGYKVNITLDKDRKTYGGSISELYIGTISKRKTYVRVLFGWGWTKDELINYYKKVLNKKLK